jgi:hypothetical protein
VSGDDTKVEGQFAEDADEIVTGIPREGVKVYDEYMAWRNACEAADQAGEELPPCKVGEVGYEEACQQLAHLKALQEHIGELGRFIVEEMEAHYPERTQAALERGARKRKEMVAQAIASQLGIDPANVVVEEGSGIPLNLGAMGHMGVH